MVDSKTSGRDHPRKVDTKTSFKGVPNTCIFGFGFGFGFGFLVFWFFGFGEMEAYLKGSHNKYHNYKHKIK